ncbi:MAG TPA: metallophosphoesterase [Thermoanaerobaculia bacterium]|jgi:predicted MPP superfamily phosphohydrolase|nr:metallophosphoesterase [Thermoanaerobaculia bacterium]
MSKRRLRELALASHTRMTIAAGVWLSLFAYAGRPLLAAAAAAGLAPAIGWTLVMAAAVIPALPMLAGRRSGAHWSGYAVLALFSTLLVLVLIGDVVRGAYTLLRWAAPTWPLLDPRTVSLTILAAAGALTLVGVVQARCPRVRNVTVPIDDLPPELDGYRIVQWSDVHVGPTIRRAFVESLVARTNALDADAVVITGDLVDGYADDLREEVQPMRGLRPRDGVFYVTGNHEYYWRASEWIPLLQSLGLDFLKNEHRVLRGGRLVIAGVTDPVGRYTHKQDPDRALAGAPAGAVKVLLSHRPQTAEAASRLGAHLQLSGHTHGGQFFPFNLFIHRFQPIAKGLHRVGRTWLYVNRGTGYWGPPTRLAVGGEITVIELRAAAK